MRLPDRYNYKPCQYKPCPLCREPMRADVEYCPHCGKCEPISDLGAFLLVLLLVVGVTIVGTFVFIIAK